MMRNENSVANAIPRYVFSSFRYDASCFVSKDSRRFGNAVPLGHVASAYTTSHDFQQALVIADFGRRHLFDSNVPVVVVHSDKHMGHQKKFRCAMPFQL